MLTDPHSTRPRSFHIRPSRASDARGMLVADDLSTEFLISIEANIHNYIPGAAVGNPEGIGRYERAALREGWEQLRMVVAVKEDIEANEPWSSHLNATHILGQMCLGLWSPDYFLPCPLPQLYIAKMQSVPGAHVGSALIEYAKTLAEQLQVQVIRLDCRKGKLAQWYEKQGFVPVDMVGERKKEYDESGHLMLVLDVAVKH